MEMDSCPQSVLSMGVRELCGCAIRETVRLLVEAEADEPDGASLSAERLGTAFFLNFSLSVEERLHRNKIVEIAVFLHLQCDGSVIHENRPH